MAVGISRPSPHAWAELNLLNLSSVVRLEGARLSRAGTSCTTSPASRSFSALRSKA